MSKSLVRVNLMLSQGDLAALDRMAQGRGVSRSALVRDLIARAVRYERLRTLASLGELAPPGLRSMTFEEALQVARNAARRLKGFDGVGEIRKWRDKR